MDELEYEERERAKICDALWETMVPAKVKELAPTRRDAVRLLGTFASAARGTRGTPAYQLWCADEMVTRLGEEEWTKHPLERVRRLEKHVRSWRGGHDTRTEELDEFLLDWTREFSQIFGVDVTREPFTVRLEEFNASRNAFVPLFDLDALDTRRITDEAIDRFGRLEDAAPCNFNHYVRDSTTIDEARERLWKILSNSRRLKSMFEAKHREILSE